MAASTIPAQARLVVCLPPYAVALLEQQECLAGRRQLLSAGATETDLRSWMRARLLTAVEPGVYVGHTGPLSWQQRAGAATLRFAPAALYGVSSVRATIGPGRQLGDDTRVHVAVTSDRRVTSSDVTTVHRVSGLGEHLRARHFPPRMELEQSTLDACVQVAGDRAGDPDHLAVTGLLAEVVGSRRTTAARLASALADRPRLRHRTLVAAVLADVAAGACSVLERRYLLEVERAHGLPVAGRQVRASARGSIFRDVFYEAYGVVVELDGRVDHTHVLDRSRDLDRDLVAAVDALVTLRIGHGQVGDGACRTAALVARVLQRHGWTGALRPCARCPGDSSRRRIAVAQRQ